MHVCGMYLGVCVFMCVVWYQVCGVRVWGVVYACVVGVFGAVHVRVPVCGMCVWCGKSPQGLGICCRGGTSR